MICSKPLIGFQLLFNIPTCHCIAKIVIA